MSGFIASLCIESGALLLLMESLYATDGSGFIIAETSFQTVSEGADTFSKGSRECFNASSFLMLHHYLVHDRY